LNVKVFNKAPNIKGRYVEGFVVKGKRFYGVVCCPCTIMGVRAYAVFPERTKHKRTIEIVAKYRLRNVLHIKEGDVVWIRLLKP